MMSSSRTETDSLLTPMPQRSLGRTGWKAGAVVLGGVKWDTQLAESQAVAFIHRAMELGVNTFDTAPGYGGGESERRLGLAMQGRRDKVFLSTKTAERDYDAARRQMDQSLERLRTDHIDLMFVHAIGNEEDYARIISRSGVLKAMEEYRAAGRIRHIGISGHGNRQTMQRIVGEYPFDAVLLPAGLFNLAYDYSFVDTVLPAARQRGMAVMGMKILGAGRIKHAASIEPYLRYSLNLPLDAMVIGCDSMEQLEAVVGIVKQRPLALSPEEIDALKPESLAITREWDHGEFNWMRNYPNPIST